MLGRTPLHSFARYVVRSLLGFAMLGGHSLHGAPLDVVVPAYFYPSGDSPWSQLDAKANQLALTAILNPGNGPGSARNTDYSRAIGSLRESGGKVIGYVYTSYGARPVQQVLQDIDRYYDWYGVDGIFVDEMSNAGAVGVINYYQQIYQHVKQRAAASATLGEVMGNPGGPTDEVFLSRPLADRLVVTENVATLYASYSPLAWYARYPAEQFVHLVHSQPGPVDWSQLLKRTVTTHARGLYVTDDLLPNPWDRLPTYWGEEIESMAHLNQTLRVDLTDDLVIDAADAGIMFGQWGGAGSADLNRDGTVDAADAGELFAAWSTAARRMDAGDSTERGGTYPSPHAVPEPPGIPGARLGLWITYATLRRLIQWNGSSLR